VVQKLADQSQNIRHDSLRNDFPRAAPKTDQLFDSIFPIDERIQPQLYIRSTQLGAVEKAALGLPDLGIKLDDPRVFREGSGDSQRAVLTDDRGAIDMTPGATKDGFDLDSLLPDARKEKPPETSEQVIPAPTSSEGISEKIQNWAKTILFSPNASASNKFDAIRYAYQNGVDQLTFDGQSYRLDLKPASNGDEIGGMFMQNGDNEQVALRFEYHAEEGGDPALASSFGGHYERQHARSGDQSERDDKSVSFVGERFSRENPDNPLGKFTTAGEAPSAPSAPSVEGPKAPVAPPRSELQPEAPHSGEEPESEKASVKAGKRLVEEHPEVFDSIVHVIARNGDGTGFLVGKEATSDGRVLGYFLTNYHVTGGRPESMSNWEARSDSISEYGQKQMQVSFEGRDGRTHKYKGEVVGTNRNDSDMVAFYKQNDLALVKVELRADDAANLQPLKLAKDSPEKAGDSVEAIGFADGGSTLSYAPARVPAHVPDYVIHDSGTNPQKYLYIIGSMKGGVSGGPTIATDGPNAGEVVGVNDVGGSSIQEVVRSDIVLQLLAKAGVRNAVYREDASPAPSQPP